jgi:dipeptidase
MQRSKLIWVIGVYFLLVLSMRVYGCTNILVTRGASVDGSTMISYIADSHELYGELKYIPPGNHIEGTMIDIYEEDTGKYLGQIKQVAKTYAVIGLMNEYQVAIGETTWGGRKELQESKGIIDYGSLMKLALQRAKTAREAIKVMTELVEEYGYASTGESFSIADPKEVWIMDMIGKGPNHKGAVWVARKLPDGYISAHANNPRIHKFPLNDPENCLYSKDVITFAREMKFFDGKDEDFDFANVYSPPSFGGLRFCEARVWRIFDRAAPSQKIPNDYVKPVPGAEPLPLWIKPDKKLSVRDVIELMRDHFEGTEFDMTKDVGAGPFQCPYRWRPLTWKVDNVEYFNERAVSTQQTGFSFVAQSRAWLPDPIGGVFWFSVDDTYSTVYVPIYAGITEVPRSYGPGIATLHNFSWDSAFWVFNVVSNFSYLRYKDMIKDIQVVQRELEGKFFAQQDEIEQAALKLYKESPRLAKEYLTKYSVSQAEMVVERWKKLAEFLFVKYLDGNVKDSLGNVTHPPYPEEWYRRIINETGDHYKVKKLPGEQDSE